MEALNSDVARLSRGDFDDLAALANLNHVVMRAMNVLLGMSRETRDTERAAWVLNALAAEQARIHNALTYLDQICRVFEQEGFGVTVIKSLDHWPDLGSDLDLYTNAAPEDVIHVMTRRFGAQTEARSWGDRLACKWNFKIPGLPESVEVHVGRLGQTGEQVSIASSLLRRTRLLEVGGHMFRVTSKTDRLLLSTLQRMYRHFYFRLCDIVDSAGMVENDGLDWNDLHAASRQAEIWEGVSTYLVIVSDYVMKYRGYGVELPSLVTATARFGGESVYYGRGFLRVPIMPQSARLYGTQLAGVLKKRELHAGARLSLLPWLATAAAVGQKITGSDKGIW
ncbi:MAG TPA: nucleotidyltransferase family protein [Terracidiphilus sp.]|nr:nucleotidyltransferase family protein [Terracidiphilus sp.]